MLNLIQFQKILNRHHFQCYNHPPALSLLFFYTCPVVVKAPQNLQGLNNPEESVCAAKNAFQEVPYSQRREEVVRSRPEAAYKRLLEACGRMPHKSI